MPRKTSPKKNGPLEFFAVREYVLGLPPVGEEDHGTSQGTNEELHNG